MKEAFESRIDSEVEKLEGALGDLIDSSAKLECLAKLEWLKQVRERNRERLRLSNPTVFVSYTGGVGEQIMKKVQGRIRGSIAPGTGVHFQVESGMRQSPGDPEVLKYIADKMRHCWLFVGIYTKTFPIGTNGEAEKSGPGVWSLVETGMAVSSGLKVILFIEEEIDRQFWTELDHIRHVSFKLPSQNSNGDLGPLTEVEPLIKLIEEVYRRERRARR